MSKCALCRNTKELVGSHIIPAFVYRWIKETSATGYLRFSKNINQRYQDGTKIKLLCLDCEKRFNTYETLFSNNIFYPYVNEELNLEGIAQGKVKSIKYTDWLLRFVISLQWRISVTSKITSADNIAEDFIELRDEITERWRRYLLNEVESTGECETHIYFLQNLVAGSGHLPSTINDRVNFYLLRSTDGTLVYSHKKLGLFSKIGPIAFFTTLKPKKLVDSEDTRIKLKGVIKTAQRLHNSTIVDFIFITRPNEVMSNVKYSEKQNKKVKETLMNNLDKASTSMTFNVIESDFVIKELKKRT